MKKIGKIIFMLAFLLAGLLYTFPIVLTVINGFKPMSEMTNSFFALPEKFSADNFREVIKTTSFFRALYNSVIVTTISVFGIVLISVMASYGIVRRRSKYNQVLYFLFVMGMAMPFTTIMVSSMRVVGFLHLRGRFALILMYFALGIPLAVFLFSGFIRASVPIELEESARIDGADPWRIFFQIVLPLMRAPIMTVVMLDTIWIWNDFLLPSILLSSKSNRTLPLSQFVFVSKYNTKYNLQFAAFTMAMIPIFILFISCQKYIIKGVAAGAVKG